MSIELHPSIPKAAIFAYPWIEGDKGKYDQHLRLLSIA